MHDMGNCNQNDFITTIHSSLQPLTDVVSNKAIQSQRNCVRSTDIHRRQSRMVDDVGDTANTRLITDRKAVEHVSKNNTDYVELG